MKQLGAFILLSFVFLASINIVVNQHFCNEDLESIAFYVKAQPCEHASDKSDLPPCHAAKKVNEKKCCSENSFVISAIDWIKIHKTQSKLFHFQAVTPFAQTSERSLFENFADQYTPLKVLQPPDDLDKKHVIHQAFLL